MKPQIEIDADSPYLPLFTRTEGVKYFIVSGSRGSAKSFCMSTAINDLSYEPDRTVLFSRYTITSAEISVIPEFTDKMDLLQSRGDFDVNAKEIVNTVSDSKIIFKGIKTSSGNQTAALKSIYGLTDFVLDEAEEMPNEDDFNKICFSIRKKNVQGHVFVVFNPPDVSHWMWNRFFVQRGVPYDFNGIIGNTCYIHTTYMDNIANLSDDFLEEVEEMKVLHDKQKKADPDCTTVYEHDFLGMWNKAKKGVIFTDWALVDEMPDELSKEGRGLDFGFTNDPTTIAHCGIAHGEIYVKLETNRSGLANIINPKNPSHPSIEAELERLEITREDDICADSAEPKSIAEISGCGYRIYGVVKGKDSISQGIDVLKRYKINIVRNSNSKKAIEEFENYVWKLDKEGNPTNVPIDAFNHFIDALRYWALDKIGRTVAMPSIMQL